MFSQKRTSSQRSSRCILPILTYTIRFSTAQLSSNPSRKAFTNATLPLAQSFSLCPPSPRASPTTPACLSPERTPCGAGGSTLTSCLTSSTTYLCGRRSTTSNTTAQVPPSLGRTARPDTHHTARGGVSRLLLSGAMLDAYWPRNPPRAGRRRAPREERGGIADGRVGAVEAWLLGARVHGSLVQQCVRAPVHDTIRGVRWSLCLRLRVLFNLDPASTWSYHSSATTSIGRMKTPPRPSGSLQANRR
jgi:hypothetical protein